jgi:anthranilate phosphoribosyltransferase
MVQADGVSPVAESLKRLAAGDELGEELALQAFAQLMRGEATESQTGALLAGLRVRGESVRDVAGAVRALRGAMVKVEVADRTRTVDTCGTGGGTVPTFNISTAAALVAAGAGAVVAKHGNRSFTSKCGSADVLEALGVEISVDAATAAHVLDRAGIVFLFAPAFHPAMRFVAPVRREIAIPTIMNLVGPLANPAGVTRQLMGVADHERGPLLAEVLSHLGAEHAMVVHGVVGMDEIAPYGKTEVWEVRSGEVLQWTLEPGDLGLAEVDVKSLAGGEPAENAARVENLLTAPDGDPAGRAAVLLNAGAAVYLSGAVDALGQGIEAAGESLRSGAAREVLERLRRETAVSTSG